MILFNTLVPSVLYRSRLLEIYEFDYQQNNNNSLSFRHFQFLKKILLVLAKSKKLKSKTILLTRSYRILALLRKSSKQQRSKESLSSGLFHKYYQLLAFLDYQGSDAKLSINYFYTEQSPWRTKMLLELMLQEFKLVNLENCEFEKLDVIFGIIFSI